MKKFLQNVLLRSVILLAFGILLIIFSSQIPQWIVFASGVLFLLMGVLVIIGYLRTPQRQRPNIIQPAVAVGSILFGCVQMIFPDLFFGVLRYLLAGIMFLLSITQIYSLIVIKKGGIPLRWFYGLVPVAGIGLTLFVIFYKNFAPNDPLAILLIGIALAIYSLLEIWTVILVRHSKVVVNGQLPVEGTEEIK